VKNAKLDRPTVAEMIAFLQTLPLGMPLRILDPDTGWTIHQVEIEFDGGKVWLTGSYLDMGGEDGLPPKPTPEVLT